MSTFSYAMYFNIHHIFLIFVTLVAQTSKGLPVFHDEDFESEPSLRSGSVINLWNDTWKVNPDELGYYFQGDIITTTTDLRSIASNESLRWPHGIVPYVVAGPYNDEGLSLLEWAFNEYHLHTCVRFRQREFSDIDYLYITNAFTGCWSSLGRQGGKQDINLQHPGCLNAQRKGTAIHELMHALGIKHEHTRIDRDDHIVIIEENIAPARSINFEKSRNDEVINYDVPYDFGSVMHYSMYAFSTDYGNKPTITPKFMEELTNLDGTPIKMGQRQGFGENDIKKLNRMYCDNVGERFAPGPTVSLKHDTDPSTSSVAEWWTKVVQSLPKIFK